MEPLRISIGGKEYDLAYEDQLKLSEETINEDLKNQPSLFAWYAVLAELADADVNTAKFNLELTESTLDGEIRALGQKLTETQIGSQVKLKEAYITARGHYLETKRNEGILRSIKEAFSQRMAAVIALASNMRAQADPEIYLKREEYRKKVT
jgi:hypothetical protein